MRSRYLYIAVFFSGMTSLAVEFAASRLLGNFFGTSNLVWASIVGLILIYLTVGYFLGGYWADRSPNPRTFLRILTWGGFLVGLIPIISRPVLRLSANAFDQLQISILAGSFISVLILFSIPVTLLGTASPFAIRLAISDAEHSGSISGKIYAISTLGSFLGTYLPTLLLVPTIGTYRTFLVIGGLMLLVALYLLGRTISWREVLVHSWMPLILIILFIFGLGGTDKTTTGMVYETESEYNYIQVLEENGYMMLRLNEGQGVHSIYHPMNLNYAGPWEQVLAAPFFNPAPYAADQVKSLAIVGLAAGTTARQATAAFGNDLWIDGYEIDPKIVEVGQKYFGMTQPNLHVTVQDGRWGLSHSQRQYQIISLDAYRPPYIPWHLTTREFFHEVRLHLADDGVMAINVGRSPSDRRLIDTICATIATEFPSIYVIDIPNTFNSIIYATVQPTDPTNLAFNFEQLAQQPGTSPLLLHSMQVALDNLQPTPSGGTAFTDDLAPIEWITNSLVLNFLFSGQAESLQ